MTKAEFTRVIISRRRYYGKSLTVLDKETGISKGNLSKIFNGKNNPQLSTMNKIAEAFHFQITHDGGGL